MVKTMKSITKATAAVAIMSVITVVVFGCASLPRSVIRPIVNNTGVPITHVYIRDAGATNWGTQLNQKARTTTETVYYQGGSYKQTVYVKDRDGNFVYDKYNLDNGEQYRYSFRASGASDGQTPQYKSIDIKFVAANGIVYGKNNVNLTYVENIVITKNDMYPILTMQNNTGFPIRITNPSNENIDNGSYTTYQIPELENDRRHIVSYSISDYRFDKEVMLDNHATLVFTERPPVVTVQNNTGYPIRITSPWTEVIENGASSKRHPKNNRNANRQIISYSSGTFQYNKEVMLNDEDVILTLTENDRPPIISIVNNTGNTVNLIFLRNHAVSDWGHNIIGIPLNEFGVVDKIPVGTAADVRRGSFTNKESFRFWLGSLLPNPDFKYDIRIDDVQGNPYVKNNEHITKDVTLTFTQKDRP